MCEFAETIGLKISINLVRVNQITISRLIELTYICQESGADILYFVDSNGSLLSEQVSCLAHVLKYTIKK